MYYSIARKNVQRCAILLLDSPSHPAFEYPRARCNVCMAPLYLLYLDSCPSGTWRPFSLWLNMWLFLSEIKLLNNYFAAGSCCKFLTNVRRHLNWHLIGLMRYPIVGSWWKLWVLWNGSIVLRSRSQR